MYPNATQPNTKYPHLYDDLTRAPIRPVTTMNSSTRMTKSVVGHGMAAVRRRSISRSGVVMNLHGSQWTNVITRLATCHVPIDVADVENFTIDTTHCGIRSHEFDVDRCPSKVGSHGEVRYSRDHGDARCNVVEDTVLSRFGESKSHECKGSAGHDSRNRPIPIRATDGDGNVHMFAILEVR